MSPQQKQWANLIVEGMNDYEAAEFLGVKYVSAFVKRARDNKQVQEYIVKRKKNVESGKIMTQQELMEHWTDVVRDPDTSTAQRTENSKLLAKAFNMFKQSSEVELSSKDDKPVMVVPNYEEYWEKENG